MAWALEQFELGPLAQLPSGQLPGGYKQRLAMAAAMLHEPEILFLDEPTSGADPFARREFWRRITALAEQGVTVIVTTHFMEEAEYCDRLVILEAGRVLAQGTPAQIRQLGHPGPGREPTMEDAFIAIVEQAREGCEGPSAGSVEVRHHLSPGSKSTHASLAKRARRGLALIRKESLQVVRDPSSIAIGIVLPVISILLLGYGLSLDVRNVPVAVVLEDSSAEAMEFAAGFQLSPYFSVRLVHSMHVAQELMLDRKVNGIIRILPDFSRRVRLGDAQVQVIVHGTDANLARIIEGYAQGAVAQWATRRTAREGSPPAARATMENRLWFNEVNESRWFLVPGLVVVIMTLIGSLLTALVMAREWERGTLEAIFVTPVRVDEILLGKTVPYFVLGMMGLTLCILAAKFMFHVPIRGSIWILGVVSILYLLVSLCIGLVISSTTKSQFVASEATMLSTFMPSLMLSGFLFDLRSMPGWVRGITYVLPARYYVALLQTLFLAGDVWGVIVPNAAVLGAMAFVLLLLTRRVTRKKLA